MPVKRVAIFVLYNSQHQILLQHRDTNTNYYPNHWGFFGGSIENDETPVTAVKREAKEELQIDLQNISLFKRYETKEDVFLCERFIFLVPTNYSVRELKKRQLEGDNLNFFDQQSLQELKLNPYTRFIFNDIFNFLNTH